MPAKTLTTLLTRFASAEKGSTAIVTALALVPFLGFTGMALDYMRASQMQTKLQVAMDSAGLAAATAKSLDEAERIAVAEKVFAANWKEFATEGIIATPRFTIDGKKVNGDIKIDIDTTLMKIVGFEVMPVNANVQVTIGEERKAEVVLVLDYSGSMDKSPAAGGEKKYIAMRKAAITMVDDLGSTVPDRVKIGLVPFSHHVRTSLPNAYVVGQGNSGTWTGCTQDRQFPHNTKDTTPIAASDATKWGHPQAPAHIDSTCDGYEPRSLTIRPLSADFAGVKTQLNAMQPYAWTHIALGFEFGWHLLTSNAPFTEGAPSSDTTTDKILVVLTDGEQTEPSFGPGGIREVWQGEKNLEKLCDNAKAEGITVMTIAYDLKDVATTDRLRNCATDPDKHFFKAEDNGDVTAAFESIKTQVANMAYLSD